MARLEEQPGAAVAGPRIVDATGRAELFFGSIPSPVAEARQKMLGALHERGFGRFRPLGGSRDAARAIVAWVSGACLLVRRADAEAVAPAGRAILPVLGGRGLLRRASGQRGRLVLFHPGRPNRPSARPLGSGTPSAVNQAYGKATSRITGNIDRDGRRSCGHTSRGVAAFLAETILGSSPRSGAPAIMGLPCASPSMPESSMISASAPTSGTCCGSSRGSTATPSTSCSAGAGLRAAPSARPELPRRRRHVAASTRFASRSRCRWRSARERVDLFHAPHYVLPPLIRCRSVVTIHDCIHLMFPAISAEPVRARATRARRWGPRRDVATAS